MNGDRTYTYTKGEEEGVCSDEIPTGLPVQSNEEFDDGGPSIRPVTLFVELT